MYSIQLGDRSGRHGWGRSAEVVEVFMAMRGPQDERIDRTCSHLSICEASQILCELFLVDHIGNISYNG